MLTHPFITGPLAEQRQADLRGHADHIRHLRARRPNGRRRTWHSTRWWRPAARPAQA